MGCRSPVEVESSVRRFWEGGERASCAARDTGDPELQQPGRSTRRTKAGDGRALPGKGSPPRRPPPKAALTSRGVAAPAALAPSAAGSGGWRRHGAAAAPAAVLPGGRGSERRMRAAGAPSPAEPRPAGSGSRPLAALSSRDPRPPSPPT